MRSKHVLIAGILVLLGWVGIAPANRWAQAYAAQKQALAQAPTLLTEVGDVSKNSNLDSLSSHQQRLRNAVQLLEGIPNLPGFDYQQAQSHLNQLRLLISIIDQRIQAETEASNHLQKALQLDAEALELASNPPHLEERLQQAADHWREALQLVEKIPANSSVYEQAQKGLPLLRDKQTQVNQWLVAEKQAVRKMEAALGATTLATELTRGKSFFQLPDLLNASTQWQRAIKLLQEIPDKTTVSDDVEIFRPPLERNLQRVKFALDKLRECQSTHDGLSSLCNSDLAIQIEDLPIQTLVSTEEPETDAESTIVPVTDTTPYITRYRSYRTSRFPSLSASSSAGSSTGQTFVRGYTRSDGTTVRSYSRSTSSRSSGFGSGRSSGGG